MHDLLVHGMRVRAVSSTHLQSSLPIDAMHKEPGKRTKVGSPKHLMKGIPTSSDGVPSQSFEHQIGIYTGCAVWSTNGTTPNLLYKCPETVSLGRDLEPKWLQNDNTHVIKIAPKAQKCSITRIESDTEGTRNSRNSLYKTLGQTKFSSSMI